MDISQYVKMFIEEANEHLQTLNTDLIKLEKEPDNKEVLNKIFRTVHSLKGMSATMGFSSFSNINQEMENVLARSREGQLRLDANTIDVLFESHDSLLRLLREIKDQGEERMDIDNLINRLQNLYSKPGEEKDALEGTGKLMLNSLEKSFIHDEIDAGKNCLIINIKLRPDCMLKSVRGFMVLKALKEKGNLIKTIPPLADIEDEKFADEFKLLFLTEVSEKKIKQEIEDIIDIESATIEYLQTEDLAEVATEKEHDAVSTFQPTPTVRINIERLDKLMNMVGELLIVKSRLDEVVQKNVENTELKDIVNQVHQLTDNLHHTVMQVRMVPIYRIFSAFPRMVREISREIGKKIDFRVQGADTELDRAIIDAVGDPLLHAIRNAIDHGIEDEETRINKGKNPTGEITLSASQRGNDIAIEIQDDGQGIDLEKVGEEAVKRGYITEEEKEEMDKDELLSFLFHPGFSTKTETTALSGMGVGLDVVQESINTLEGNIEIETAKDEGTLVRIILPLTLSITQALLVNMGDETYAIPLSMIHEIETSKIKDLKKIHGHDVLMMGDRIIHLNWGADVLNVSRKKYAKEDEVTILIVKQPGKVYGFVVDEVIVETDIVIKPLGGVLSKIKEINGATILGDGTVALILDMKNLA